ncbi:peptidyl-prolyl cis-trans isomerase B (cyclophilin B) [Streptacidiphilus sp. MAP12-20]|uniref:peptidylprolyl isomerase n=1 Tax=Streptacidiphilus sp. MAP12-20 TaxID=3156299 RepID=UPI003518EC42
MAPNDTRRPQQLPKDKEKRRRELQRMKLERQAAARAQRVTSARKNTAIVAAAVVAVAAVATGAVLLWPSGGAKNKPSADAMNNRASSSAAPSTAPSASTAKAAYTITPKSDGSWKTEPAMSIDTSGNYTAKINLGQGSVTIKLDAAAAPHTVNSFVFLANNHFFDNVYCHRLTTAGIYVLQCGDPTGTGSGGPGYQFKDENLTASSIKGGVYPAGTIAMANSGANTNGSQFFLVYKDSQLSPNYTPFGTITGGLDVLTGIAAKGADSSNGSGDGKPMQPVIMNSVTAGKG